MSRNPADDNTALWSATLNAFASRDAGLAILSGCTVSKGSGDFDSDVASGTLWLNGSRVSVSSSTVTHTDTSGLASGDTRVDLVTANSSGTVSITEGTGATDPTAPDIPTDEVLLGYWQIAGDDSSLSTADLFDLPDLAIEIEDLTSAAVEGAQPVVQSNGGIEMRQAELPQLSEIDNTSLDKTATRIKGVTQSESWGSVGYLQGVNGGPEIYDGAVLLGDGRVLMPLNATSTGVKLRLFDPSDNTVSDGPDPGEGKEAFVDGVLVPDGRVVLVPNDSDNVGLFDPADDTYTSSASHGEGDNAFRGGALAPDGRVIFAPASSSNVGIFDPSNNTYTSGPAHGQSVNAFRGAALMGDGRILFAPTQSDNIGLFDPADDSYTSGPAHNETKSAFSGAVSLSDGRLVLSPVDSDNVGLFDPADDSYTSGPAHGVGTNTAFRGLAPLPDGRVVLVPKTADNVGIFDPSDDSYTSGPSVNGTDSFFGGTQLRDGRVFMTPNDANNEIGLVISNTQFESPARTCTHPLYQGY